MDIYYVIISISHRTSVFVEESTSQFFIKNNYIKLVNCTISDSQSRYGKKKIKLRFKKRKKKEKKEVEVIYTCFETILAIFHLLMYYLSKRFI